MNNIKNYNIKNYIGILFEYMHFLIGIILTIFLIYTNNIYFIIFMLFGTFILMSSWYFFNDCLLFGFQNYLLDKENKYNNYQKFKIIKIYDRKYYIYDYILYSKEFYADFFVFLIALCKLIYVCYKKKML